MMGPFSVSILIPALNSKKTIGACLESIAAQDYPKEDIEIIIADGGSTDGTLEIVKSISAQKGLSFKVLHNALKTGEAGKAVAAKAAKNEIAVFIDSDNILPSGNWLRQMTGPFSDPDIAASEPLEYGYRKQDGYITRYSALLGMNDPLCLFMGNYDRISLLTGKWTGLPHREEDKAGYIKAGFDAGRLPTIGANGFLIRRELLNRAGIGDYLFDIDVLAGLLENSGRLYVAKVKTSIIHIFSGGVKDFIRKQRRRILDYAYYKKLGLRKYRWSGSAAFWGTVKFIIFTVLVFPLLIQAITGYTCKRDKAWFFHIPACVITLFVYAFSTLQNLFTRKPLGRQNWQV